MPDVRETDDWLVVDPGLPRLTKLDNLHLELLRCLHSSFSKELQAYLIEFEYLILICDRKSRGLSSHV